MFDTVLLEINNHIATIIFNRPMDMNSFNNKMADELQEITSKVRENDSIRAVLLKGAGDLFMAGGDIRFFHNHLDSMSAGVEKIVNTLNASVINLMRMPKPVLASVHGSVAGVGISFMMACDLVIAADNTKFTLAYSGLGISPDGGASYLLPRLVGTKKAMEWFLLSEIFDAATAKEYGLINWLVGAQQLEQATEKLITRLAKGPTQSYAHTKQLVHESWSNNLEAQLALESKSFVQCTTTADFKVGVTSFLKKSKPEFVGN